MATDARDLTTATPDERVNARPENVDLGSYKFGWHDPVNSVFTPKRGLSHDVVEEISAMKGEPEWMRQYRHKALDYFYRRPMPSWGSDLSGIDFDNIFYFLRATEKQADSWEDLPADIRDTYDKLGIPEAEKQRLVAGVAAQYESEVVYHKVREDLEAQGVVFMDTDSALREHPEIFREHWGTIIPANDNKFSALNSAVWSGGSFVWVPEGVHVEIPLQAYFRINSQNMGQFERTLIIAEPGSSVHYVEGCLPAGELIATADGGHRPIETIRVGDRVLTHEGRPARVKAVQVRDHRGPLYTFTPVSPENRFRVTGEHPLLVIRREDVRTKRATRNGWKPEVSSTKLLAATPDWVPAKDVAEGDFLVFPKPRPAPAATMLPLAFARLAGYYLADGSASLTNGCKSLAFSLNIHDHESVDEIRRLTKELYDAEGSVLWNEAKGEARVLVSTKAGYEAMRQHLGTRSHTKQLSPELAGQDDTFLRNLLETYLRGDGNHTVRGGGNWYRAHTTSRTLALQLQAIVARFGIYATVSMERLGGAGEILGRQVIRHDMYRVQWTEDGKGPRAVRDAGDYFLVPVQRITTEDFDAPVHNLDVESPDTYLATGFAVHNCTAPIYSSDSLHSAVVEIIVKPHAKVRYTTIQNWSNNVYNLVTKRAAAYEGATMEWIDGNIGSKVTMKYPAVLMLGEHAHGEILSVAMAGRGQHQDAGAKLTFAAPNTTGQIVSKSISRDTGRTSYRGLIKVEENAPGVRANVRCDALMLDDDSRSDTYPYMDIKQEDVTLGHEATVSKIGDDQLFYLQARGLSEAEATAMIVRGFVEPVAKELPMEYALELNRLISLQMEGSIG